MTLIGVAVILGVRVRGATAEDARRPVKGGDHILARGEDIARCDGIGDRFNLNCRMAPRVKPRANPELNPELNPASNSLVETCVVRSLRT